MDRRQFSALGLIPPALAAGLGLAVPSARSATTKLRVVETVHIMFFTPAYVAMRRNFFAEQGIEIELSAALSTDKATALLLSGAADVMLTGPEATFYVGASQSPTKVKMFASIGKRDGSMLVGRTPAKELRAQDLKGKTIIGSAIGSAPALFLNAYLRKKGVDPSEVTIIGNVAPPAKRGAFLAGQGDYGAFFEPDASAIELSGKGYVNASIGQEIGAVDHTVFSATEPFIAANAEVLQRFTVAVAKAQAWLRQASAEQVSELIAPEFPGVPADVRLAATRRGQTLDMWKAEPSITPEAVEAFRRILVDGGTLKNAPVPFESIVETRFMKAAKA